MTTWHEDLTAMVKAAAMRRNRILSRSELDRVVYVVTKAMAANGWTRLGLAVAIIDRTLDGLGVHKEV